MLTKQFINGHDIVLIALIAIATHMLASPIYRALAAPASAPAIEE